MIIDPAAFGLALLALESGGPVNVSLFDKAYCTYFSASFPPPLAARPWTLHLTERGRNVEQDTLYQPTQEVNSLVAAVNDALSMINSSTVAVEPLLQVSSPISLSLRREGEGLTPSRSLMSVVVALRIRVDQPFESGRVRPKMYIGGRKTVEVYRREGYRCELVELVHSRQ